MNGTDLISVLDDHGFTDTSTSRKVGALNDVYWDICARQPWSFLEKDLNLTFDGSTGLPTNWPTDFVATLVLVDTVTGNRLYPIRLEEFRAGRPLNLNDKGNPAYYYFLSDDLFVWPIPSSSSASNNIKMTYIHWPAELTSSSVESAIVVPKRFHMAIPVGALIQLYALEDDFEASDRFERRFERRMVTMLDQVSIRQFDRPDTIEIIDPEDYYS